MQKNNKKASILIWAIFLSLIVSISFLSISTKISKNLKNSNNYLEKGVKQNEINNLLKSSTENKENIGNTAIEIENKTLKRSLKKNEIYKIYFPTSSNINIKLNSGIIFYNFNSNSGFLKKSNNSLDFIGNGELILENYAGFSSFELTSDNKFDIPEKKYKIIEKIGNKEVIKSFGVIK